MLIKILIVLAVVVIGFVIVVALRPSDFRVSRSITMAAPPTAPFEFVNDFRQWSAWSPYDKRDPAMKKTYDGPAAGVGASYAWSGNNEVGEGRSTITESVPAERVGIRLEFVRPFAGTNAAEFTFKPNGEQTVVTWSLSGKYNFISKAVGLFINMDKMIGGDFEKGLVEMKAIAEQSASVRTAALN